jgi:SAM-dependent methyltransferase
MTRQSERDLQVYDHIWREEGELAPAEQFVEMTRLVLAGGGDRPHIADLGCGSGRHALHAARAGLRVTAIDHSARAVERVLAAVDGLSCEVRQGDAFTWLREQPSQSLDGIVCFDAVHHLSSDASAVSGAIADMVDRLRLGGLLLVSLLTDIEYSSGERPSGRLFLGAEPGRRFLARAAANVEPLREDTETVFIPQTVSQDPRTRELVPTTYRATRLILLGRRVSG